MKNSMICRRCLEDVVFNSDGTNAAVNAIAADAVATVKQRLSVFTPFVCNFYVSLRNTNKMLSQKFRAVRSAIDNKMRRDDYLYTDMQIRQAEGLSETIQRELEVTKYMLAFLETHCSDEVSIMVRNMSFREIEEILSK